MAEAPYTGLTAAVKVDGVTIGYISGVDLDLEKEIIEILAFGMTYKEKVPAIKDWSASVDGTAAFANGGTQEALYTAFTNDTKVELGIFLDANTYFLGDAYISALSISAAPDDKIELTAEFAGTGGVVLTVEGSSSMANVYSSVYVVDQTLQTISGSGTVAVATFKANLTMSAGATLEVYEPAGMVVETGNMVNGDWVLVTAENGSTKRMYTVVWA